MIAKFFGYLADIVSLVSSYLFLILLFVAGHPEM